MRTRHLVVSLLTVSLLCTSGALYSQDNAGPHDAAIKARQAMFQLRGFYIGILSAMAKGERDYDAELAAEAAAGLDAAGSVGQSAMWPEGSDSDTDGNRETRALPDIWQNFPDVMEKHQAMLDATAALVPVAGNGLDELKGALGDVGSTCKACHDDYRLKKD